jgi:hypothetical protein
MSTSVALADILDQTVAAFRELDLDALEALEKQIVTLAEASARFELDEAGPILSKKRLLEFLLQNCQVNLDALTKLHARNLREQWAQ